MDGELELMEFEDCPKCGFENNADDETCARCGIVFSKYDPSSETSPQSHNQSSNDARLNDGGRAAPSGSSAQSSSDSSGGGLFGAIPWRPVVVAAVVLGALGYWFFLADDYEVVGPEPGSGSSVLILMHGHGAQGDDMVQVAEMIAEGAPDTTFVMPPGPHSKMFGSAWMTGGTRAETEAQVQESRDVILDVVEDMEKAGVASEDIYLGGFSQGGQMALEIAGGESVGREFGGLLIMSGGWPNWPSDIPPMKGANLSSGARVFMSHGKRDKIFAVQQARKIAEELESLGVSTELHVFSGGHTVTPPLIDKYADFLDAH